MLQLIPLLWRRFESASVPGIAHRTALLQTTLITVPFWTLAVIALTNLGHAHLGGGAQVEVVIARATMTCCVLLLGLVGVRRLIAWRKSGSLVSLRVALDGMPGMLLFAAVASYLAIGAAVLGVEAISQPETAESLKYRVLQFGVLVAAAVGARAVLERTGAERLLKWTLVTLTASCVVVLASPWLRAIGVLPEYRLPHRLTGAFVSANDAGFIACMTVALALAFQANGRQRPLGHLALVLGCVAGLATFSYTAAIVLGVMLILFLLLNVRRLGQDLLHTGLTVLCMAGVLVWLVPGTPVVYTGEAWVVDANDEKQVGDPVTVFLVNDKSHRADDNPASPWRWQRADARPGDADTPDDATWTDIEGALSPNYTPAKEDAGKFLRAWVSYEKNSMRRRVQTQAIGPIMAAATGTATDANALVHLLKEPGKTVVASRGKDDSNNSLGRTRSRRTLLWKMGFDKALEAPITGHGLYQLHHMEGAPIGHQGKPLGAHNVYLMLVGEAGIVPLALYLLSLFFLLRLYWTAPKSLGRDLVVGWVIVMGLYGLSFHHLLTMGAYNFLIGLACAMAAFLVQGQRDPAAAGRRGTAELPGLGRPAKRP